MTISLTATKLTYERDEQPIFTNINFTLQAGDILQVAGGNGSGKTTLLRILTGLLQPTQGEITWCGQTITTCRTHYQENLFYLGHKPGVKTDLTPYENLNLTTALTKLKYNISLKEALAQVGLNNYEDSFTYQLSAGQQRRLALAKLLIIAAKIWILDEPFTALDTLGVRLAENFIVNHLEQGGIVILTSHQLYKLPNVKQKQLILD